MVKSFIWDFDGTLFDTYPVLAELIQTVFMKHGIHETKEAITRYMKVSMGHMYTTYVEKYPESVHAFDEYDSIVDEYSKQHIRLFPNALDICKRIVDCGGRNFLFTHRGSSTSYYMCSTGLNSLFTECITSENGFKKKPDPEAILYLLDKYSLNPLQTVMIGDREIDVQSGKAAGILTCFCDIDQSRKPDFVDYSFSSLIELKQII